MFQEVEVLKKLRHPNIISMHEVVEHVAVKNYP